MVFLENFTIRNYKLKQSDAPIEEIIQIYKDIQRENDIIL